ncbi:MAG: repressor LexA [Proteobacteria bacterium]|nr:MAG: repressor LexA [Pseudomonadota bacterium]
MLTRRQQEVWEAIQKWYFGRGYTPTLDEIAQAVGISARSTVHQHVQTLIREGYLLPAEGKRAYKMPKQLEECHPQINLSLTALPLIGQIAAGCPIEAIKDSNEVNPNELFLGPGRYALKVRGDSMVDIGIMNNDYVVIQEAESARNGEIVVALVNREEVTLKRIFYRNDGQVELRPENSDLQPMFYPAESVQIQGKMVGLFRSL